MVMAIDVVVPSYRRSDELVRCIDALREQHLAPKKVIIVARPEDSETHSAVAAANWERLVVTEVSTPGMIAAMQRGAAASTADVIAFTDDDAAPHADWISKLTDVFEDPRVGAVGGRDVLEGQTVCAGLEVGRLLWYGHLSGNHNLGTGRPRIVDCLKGVNMAFRADALAFARNGLLRGAGAQPHNEPIMCRYVQKQGLRVVYDPAIAVDHFPAVRPSGDNRGQVDRRLVADAAHNLLVSVCALDRVRIPRQVAYSALVGSGAFPGGARVIGALLERDRDVLSRWAPSFEGMLLGLKTLAATAPAEAIVTCVDLRAAYRAA
jgi:GT2 family glycosyltransferase